MKKILSIAIATLFFTALVALASGALFTSATKTTPATVTAASLGVEMTTVPLDTGSGIPAGDQYIPGDHREYKITVENKGSLDARWRIGMKQKPSLDGTACPDAYMKELVVTFYAPHMDGSWKPVKSAYIKDFLQITGDPTKDGWIYDKELSGDSAFVPIKPGEKKEFIMQIDYDLTALKEAQNGVFNGDLVLDGTQVNAAAATWPAK